MAKTSLDPVIRALVGVDRAYLGVVADIANRLNSTDASRWHDRLTGALQEGLPPEIPTPQPAPKPRLIFLKTVSLVAAGAKKTSDCLVGDIYGYRDSDIDDWLPKQQPACEAGPVSVYATGQDQTFVQMFRAALKLADDAPLDVIAKLLIERKYAFVLQQIDQMVERQEKGEDVGLRTDGWANFFPAVDANGSVSVVSVPRHGGRWDRYVDGLDRDGVWDTDRRLVLSNSDTSNL